MSAGQVDDRESAEAQGDAGHGLVRWADAIISPVGSVIVRPAMPQHAGHSVQYRLVNCQGRIGPDSTGNAAHGEELGWGLGPGNRPRGKRAGEQRHTSWWRVAGTGICVVVAILVR